MVRIINKNGYGTSQIWHERPKTLVQCVICAGKLTVQKKNISKTYQRSVLRRQSRDTNRNIKRSVNWRFEHWPFVWEKKPNQILIQMFFSLWRRAYARNVRLYYPYRQYTNLFIFRLILKKHIDSECYWRVWIKPYWVSRLAGHKLPGGRGSGGLK